MFSSEFNTIARFGKEKIRTALFLISSRSHKMNGSRLKLEAEKLRSRCFPPSHLEVDVEEIFDVSALIDMHCPA